MPTETRIAEADSNKDRFWGNTGHAVPKRAGLLKTEKGAKRRAREAAHYSWQRGAVI